MLTTTLTRAEAAWEMWTTLVAAAVLIGDALDPDLDPDAARTCLRAAQRIVEETIDTLRDLDGRS